MPEICSDSKIHKATIWEISNEYRILVGKSFGKRPLGRQRGQDDNIMTNFRKTGCEDGRSVCGSGSCIMADFDISDAPLLLNIY
jgi:hypothetical protein